MSIKITENEALRFLGNDSRLVINEYKNSGKFTDEEIISFIDQSMRMGEDAIKKLEKIKKVIEEMYLIRNNHNYEVCNKTNCNNNLNCIECVMNISINKLEDILSSDEDK